MSRADPQPAASTTASASTSTAPSSPFTRQPSVVASSAAARPAARSASASHGSSMALERVARAWPIIRPPRVVGSPRRSAQAAGFSRCMAPSGHRGWAAILSKRAASRGACSSCSTPSATTAPGRARYRLPARSSAWAWNPAMKASPASSLGVTSDAGKPEAPAPARSASTTVTRAPSAIRARATAAPAIPAPITATWRGRSVGASPAMRASSRSRFLPWPGFFSTVKPCSARPRRTAPATVKVASRAPGLERAATRARISGDHMPGFSAGENPSRNQASAGPDHWSSAQRASPTARSIVAPHCGRSSR